MRSENPDTALDAGAAGRTVAVPVACSVLLHALVFGFLARASFAPPAEARIADKPPNIRVTLAMRAPPRVPQELTESRPAGPEVEPLQETARNIVSTEQAPDAALPELVLETDETAPGPTVPAWSPATVRAAVGTFVDRRQSTVTQSWVADCIIEQKEQGTRDCERRQEAKDHLSESVRAGHDAAEAAFAGITRPQRHARLTEEFSKKNALMASLMEDADGVGVLAAERNYLNREYLFYLNGNAGDPIFATMQNFQADVTGGPRLSLPGNIRFRCRRSPCVYEYTGFKVQGPEAEAPEDEFRVVPTVFGDRH